MTTEEIKSRIRSIIVQMQDDDIEDAYQELVKLYKLLDNEN